MGSTKRPYFLAEDDGLASVVDMEVGISGYNNSNSNNHSPHYYQHGFVSRSMGYAYATSFNRGSFRNHLVSSPRSGRFYDPRFEEPQPHFLHACFLCKNQLGENSDIYMYRISSTKENGPPNPKAYLRSACHCSFHQQQYKDNAFREQH
ncbi:FCS-Like Zinc finger 2-like [Senna tora]|uniref:FCS-Like Zinc finger 2-like n=1 Tax=Senna tora TaxID=362788 RepID=A0A834WGC7_9FABA|nr:FCS-Like Zinc finger 2-like [Senna tora]